MIASTTPRRIPFWPLVGLVLLGLMLAGCRSMTPAGSDPTQVSREFLQRLRWQDYPGAARFLEPSRREEFLERMRAQPDLRIVDVRLEALETWPAEQRATARAEIQYHVLPSITVRSRILDQEWRLLPEPGYPLPQWRLVSPFPDLGGVGSPPPQKEK